MTRDADDERADDERAGGAVTAEGPARRILRG
jgi:hypothetical protein